ncbi:hypothetical protein CONLIGDRAFT_626703 [Coniochaeta ligniaria NRRL 30616]|uniref:MARVEL domain-containing protein n=1 Tax=Coniochaeta ligniaria NRRL 30616 TaxID=1408157 RepID=A0A1J7K3C3_9PEZI|nr:hypothetical protein CONLIGDRAFT_626703 [Coniochaeta ligniaria NRRL 30616]
MADSPAAVHLEPRERGALDGTMPFRTVYLAFRAVTLGLEVATLGYLIWMSVNYSNRTGHYACGIVATVLALTLDALAIGVLAYKTDLSGCSGACFNCGDVVVLVVSIVGWLLILLADFNLERSPPRMPWNDYEDVGAFMVMGMWIAHFVLSILNCTGCCVSCGRARRAKRRTQRIVYLVPVLQPPVPNL